MKQYLDFTYNKANYSFKHSFGLVFSRIETVLFSFLCIIFLVASKLNSNFSKTISFSIVKVSMPIVKVAAFPFNGAIDLLTNFHELASAREENKALKIEIEKLRSLYVTSININEENKELRNVLNFISLKTAKFKAARIIGKSHQIFNQKLYIDAGKNRDVKEGNILVGSRGVIGRVSEVGEDKSRVILLTDANSHIPVISSKSRSRGILAGNNSGVMDILYLPKKHGIEEGEWIFTSGDGDTLPPGLLVGVVKKIDEEGVAVNMVEDVNNSGAVTIMDY